MCIRDSIYEQVDVKQPLLKLAKATGNQEGLFWWATSDHVMAPMPGQVGGWSQWVVGFVQQGV